MKAGFLTPPADLRYLRKGLIQVVARDSRSRVASFLKGIYESTAETLPDVRDNTFDGETRVIEPSDPVLLEDDYVKAMDNGPSVEEGCRKGQKNKKNSRWC